MIRPNKSSHRGVYRESKKPTKRQQQNDGEAAGHERQACLLRGIPEQRLREERDQQSAAKQGKSQHEHQQVRDAKGAVAEEVEIDDGIFVSPLPDDYEDQGGRADDAKA